MDYFSWFVAKRLFAQGGSSGRASRLATGIATVGVAIGLAVMLVSVSIVLGFQKEVQDKVLGFGAHIKVLNYKSIGQQEFSPIVIDDSITSKLQAIPNVASVARFCIKPGMLKTDANFKGIAIQGIGQDYDQSFISSHLVKGEIPEFTDSVSSGKLVISQAMAREMQVDTGQEIYAYFFEKTVRARKFTVAGIYQTNLTDFDKNFAYTDLCTIHRLLGWDSQQYAGAEIRLKDFERLDETLMDVINKVNHKQDAYGNYYSSLTIRQEHPQIFGWLQLLDMDIVVILILMICISTFTAVSGLLIIILERTNFIGIMKALGARNKQVRHLFLNYALLIILRGIVLGNLLAFALIYLQKQFGLITLNPEVYYVEAVPVLVNWWWVLAIDLGTLVVSALAMIVPSFVVSNITPAKSIRFE
ncbi:MAG: ABC transporter permease [Bacteroidaceae bacterium]|nr:ABC transporter permease [Bacteroidaceae bacterium]